MAVVRKRVSETEDCGDDGRSLRNTWNSCAVGGEEDFVLSIAYRFGSLLWGISFSFFLFFSLSPGNRVKYIVESYDMQRKLDVICTFI